MAIDKAHSKPWVKVTVWILTLALIFAFLGAGILAIDWKALFGNNAVQAPQGQDQETDNEFLDQYYASILESYETSHTANPDDAELTKGLAQFSAEYGSWLYQVKGNDADYPRAITLLQRAIELDPEGQSDKAQTLIDQIQTKLGK